MQKDWQVLRRVVQPNCPYMMDFEVGWVVGRLGCSGRGWR